MTTAVLLALRGPIEAEVATALARRREFVVARRCVDLAEAIAAAAAGVGAVAVVSDQPRLDRAVVRAFAKSRVAVVGVPSGVEAATRMLGLGVATVVPPGASADEVVAAVDDAVRVVPDEPTPDESAPEAAGHVVAVWGPTGAPGRTTLAVNLAAETARATGSVLLVDADTYGGAVAQALGLVDEAPGIAAVARAALQGGGIGDAIRRHAVEVAPGLRVLSGLSRPARWRELSAAALEPTWATLRAEAALTIIDCGFGVEADGGVGVGAGRNDAALSALGAADLIVVVGASDPLGIQRLVQALSDLGDLTDVKAPRLVVANRVRSSVSGARPANAVADVLARFAAVPEVWIVPDDPKACDAATLAGRALAERSPHSPARRAIEAIAKRVLADVSALAPVATG